MTRIVPPGDEVTAGAATRDPQPALPSSVGLGGFGPSLTEQGFAPFLIEDELMRFEACDQSISRLWAHGLLTQAQCLAARKKLAMKIKKALRRPVSDGALGRQDAAAVESLRDEQLNPTELDDE